MTKKVIVDPVTRIEGHLHIETDVDGNGNITGAYSSGTMFRGIEEILQGRDPRDAWAITQRICGVCTIVHAMASVRAVENAVGYNDGNPLHEIPTNARLIRNILGGVQMVQDQVVHFYQLTSPDWMNVISALSADPQKAANFYVKPPAGIPCMSNPGKDSKEYFAGIKATLSNFVGAKQLGIFGNAYWGHPGYKLPPELNLILFAHYLEALDWQRRMVKIHAIFGGRNPHPNFVIGGVPCNIGADAVGDIWIGMADNKGLKLIGDTLKDMQTFVTNVHLPDMKAIARFYPEWFSLGEGLGNFLTFGDYPQDNTQNPALAIPSGAIVWPRDANHQRRPISQFSLSDVVYPVDLNNPNEIQEFVSHSWLDYKASKDIGLHPFNGETTPDYTGPKTAYAPHTPVCDGGQLLYDPGRGPEYSWLKTPRWNGKAMEVGPLARVLMLYATGDSHTQSLVNDTLGEIKQPLTGMFSTMGRLLAEALDTEIIGNMTTSWFGQLKANIKSGDFATHNATLFHPATWPAEVTGVGITEAPRGALQCC